MSKFHLQIGLKIIKLMHEIQSKRVGGNKGWIIQSKLEVWDLITVYIKIICKKKRLHLNKHYPYQCFYICLTERIYYV